MIKLKNIEKYYSSGFVKTYVLRNVSLDIKEGEFLTIMGPSGAGKSTLMNIIGMLDTASDGEYLFYDNNVTNLSEKQRSEFHKMHLGFVFQSYHLIDELTVYENIETPLLYKKIKSSERKGMVSDIPGPFPDGGKKRSFPEPALRRAAAACGCGKSRYF